MQVAQELEQQHAALNGRLPLRLPVTIPLCLPVNLQAPFGYMLQLSTIGRVPSA